MSNLRTDGNNNTDNIGSIQITNTYFITFWKQLIAFEQDQENCQSIETIDILKHLPHLTLPFTASMSKYTLSKAINMDGYMAVN